MNKDEFQKKYHNYSAKTEEEANAECEKVKKEIDFDIVVKEYPTGYCLMLKFSVDFLSRLGL